MTLTLEITGPQADKLGTKSRKVFQDAGGTIGRLPTNDLVLVDAYVSSRHALIHFRNGVFYIEDRSTNGVFINSPDRRLEFGQPYALQSGDWIFIEPYEIRASISAAPARDVASPRGDVRSAQPAGISPASSDPFGLDDGFGRPGAVSPASVSPSSQSPLDLSDGSAPQDVDPLRLLGLQGDRPPERRPAANDLLHGSVLQDHYQPPAAPSPSSAPAPHGAVIPEGYDPVTDDRPQVGPSAAAEPPASAFPPRGRSSMPHQVDGPPASPLRRPVEPVHSRTPEIQSPSPERAAPAAPKPPAPHSATPIPAANASLPGSLERARGGPSLRGDEEVTLAEVLAGAGFDGVTVTPELARDFGEILRVVVAGVMAVLESRQRIKDEFRLPHTIIQRAANNPLKFSADVDDALHKLLVKRNASYLGPVEAFSDAFNDIRNHQMAMLEGVRAAFDAMLARFDPDRLQEEFDRTVKRGALLAMPAKLRYWELYRDKIHDMVADADRTFRSLFGDEFATAYEEQLKRLKAEGSSDKS